MKNALGSNVHVLPDEVIKDFEEKYDIHVEGNYIIFSLSYQKYIRAYPIGKKFSIMTKDKTKMTIQPITVEYWIKHNEFSLFRIQNAINKLVVFNQDLNDDNITKELNNK